MSTPQETGSVFADYTTCCVTSHACGEKQRKDQENRRRKADGDAEAHIVAIACSEAPENRARWTLQLIADDPSQPGVCLDETNRQHVEKTRLPLVSGSPELVSYEYRRNGVADLFMAFEPCASSSLITLRIICLFMYPLFH